MPDVVANDALCGTLGLAADTGKLNHAYILEGAAGMGKHMIAQRLFMSVCCQERGKPGGTLPCMHCPACKKILSGNNPDMSFVHREADKASLGIDPIRGVREDVVLAPIESPMKVYIIEDAQLMTTAAQNAFLLTLEEPPAYVLFLLLCTDASVLLETIRSRAPVLRLLPADTALTIKALRQSGIAAAAQDELEQVALAANGSIGRALSFLNDKSRTVLLEKRTAAAKFAEALIRPVSPETAFPLLDALGSKREDLGESLERVQTALRDLALLKRDETAPLLFYTDRDAAELLVERVSAKKLLYLWQTVDEARDAIVRRNANIPLTMSRLALGTGLVR